jgi:hypothetical protein
MPDLSSKLEPFRDFIAAERRKRTTYRRIAELLAEKGVKVDYSTIHAFVKVRSKAPRKVITMWEPPAVKTAALSRIQDPAAEAPHTGAASEIHAEHTGQGEAIRRLKAAKPGLRRSAKGLPSFNDDAPLDQLSEEEARRLRDDL